MWWLMLVDKLDKKWEPNVWDFGLSRSHASTSEKGTLGGLPMFSVVDSGKCQNTETPQKVVVVLLFPLETEVNRVLSKSQ